MKSKITFKQVRRKCRTLCFTCNAGACPLYKRALETGKVVPKIPRNASRTKD